MNSIGECWDVFNTGLFDYWVISHTLLPFLIYWTGVLRPIHVLLLVYLWETIEVGIRQCSGETSNWAEEEAVNNSLVVDPVVAICAMMVQVLLRYRFDIKAVPATNNRWLQVIMVLVVCAPTILFFDSFYDRDMHYIFLVSALGLMGITKSHSGFGWYDGISILFMSSIFLSINFATETNSFLVAILVSSIFICTLVISIGVSKRTFSGIENFI